MSSAEIGIIGGSGLYSMPGFSNIHEERVETPFGSPSDAFVLGELEGRKVAFLARHGQGHRILPSELNFRANIYAFKKLGVERILSVSAVGSLKEETSPPISSFPTSSSTAPSIACLRSSATASWATSRLAILFVRLWPVPQPMPARRSASPASSAERMSAWRARNSPPRPSRTCTAVGART